MPTSTYTPIATYTAPSAQSSYTFTSFSGYTDLRLIVAGTLTSLEDIGIQFNGDTGSNYSQTYILGTGSGSGSSGRQSNATQMNLGALDSNQSVAIFDFINYSNSTTYKTALNRSSAAAWALFAKVGLWRNTAAITSIKVMPVNHFATGTTLTLYGIQAA